MLIKTELNDVILNLLREDYIMNLNIFGCLENIPSAEIYVDNPDKPTGVLVKKDEYMHFLYTKNDSFIEDVVEKYMNTGYYGFSGVENSIVEKINEKLKGRGVLEWKNPCVVYYMPKENVDLSLIKNKVSSIDIKDAQVVDKYYTYRSEDSLEDIKKDILYRPSSAIYVDGEIVCWVIVHSDNSMGILYTKEEYRRKGYAIDVTIDLASKLISKGRVPYIQIVEDNQMSPGVASLCGFVQCGRATWFGVKIGDPD
ncbi:GNAT family N-acetyltransferase [Alloiococcus sp. CFN-8]|uniref:GNAT family N-acetyltransferase n=1 Tax=Alloiococcus sp. CFN-8 TaxID=3416081 RepID=UPI003CEAB04D